MPRGKSLDGVFDYKKLISFRREKKITQSELADRIGASVSTLSKIEKGGRSPGMSLNKLICIVLDVPEDTFIIKNVPPKPELAAPIQDTQLSRIEVQLDRMERKTDRIEMIVRSIQNENIVLRQELLKRK
ncbi:MAG: helix-turn-helix transcriptional regulator [Oscillospiraceae bacterium]|nr:helix-turn-helix transcriptional regulator [Oscillospiraceae bacterium]